jgi:class 3 adenylate cyclase
MNEPFDIHMEVALNILELLHKHNQSEKDDMRQFQVRVGVNENTDNLIVDINGNKNIAGAGITEAQRIMDQGEGNTIFVGQNVYSHLYQREKYADKFKPYMVMMKHKKKVEIYQYVDRDSEAINSSEIKPMANFIEAIRSHTGKLKDRIFL